MQEGFVGADIILLALIAGFVLLRLRGTLGKHSDDSFIQKRMNQVEDNERIIQLPERNPRAAALQQEDDVEQIAKLAAPEVATSLMAIKQLDVDFSPKEFVEGAKMAYEMTIMAFARGDKNQLKSLLGDEVYAEFAAEIDARASAEQTSETTLVAIIKEDITEAALKGSIAQVTVKFTTDQVQVTRNRDGQIVAGDASITQRVEDEWTFERDTRSRNPNWKIIAT